RLARGRVRPGWRTCLPRRSLMKAGRQRNPIVAAGPAASTERTEIALPAGIAFLKSEGFREQARRTRNSTEGNEGSEGFYADDPNRIFVFFVAFCKDLYCIAGGTPATRVTLDRLRRDLPFSSMLYEPLGLGSC